MRKRIMLVLTFLVLLVVTQPLTAQSRSITWRRYDVYIDDVNTTDNSFDVAEIYEIYSTGSFRFGSAVIEDSNLESISNILVLEDGQQLQPGCSERPATYCVTQVEEGISIVYYFDQPIQDDSQTFELRYTVNGALRVYEGGDQLWWIAVPEEKFGYAVTSSTVTVDLPDDYAPRPNVDPVATYGSPAEVSVDGTRIVARTTNGVRPNDTFEIRVQFPSNPQARVASWQAAFDARREAEPFINIASIVLGLLIGLGGPLGVFYLYYSRGRDPKIGVVPEYLSELPSNLPPGVVGALLDERADLRDVLSTMIDLSQRGYIVIEEDRREGFFGLGGGSEFTFKRTDKPDDDLRGFEQTFLSRFFGRSMERSLDSLKNKFYMYIPELQNDLYREIVSEGLFRASPNATRNGWSALGVLIMVIAGGLGFLLFNVLDPFIPSVMLPLIALGVSGLAMLIAASFMPSKTAKGAEEAAKWRAFREYLVNLEKYKSLEEAAANFDAFLPYAVAFGLERSWIGKFSRLETMSIPIWYYPRYRGGYWSRGYMPGTPLGGGLPSAGDVLPGELARAGGGGLDSMAGGLSGGLDSIASGLTGMLNSAGSVMTSRPQSSGSGGFSGGGFSGGGGSGGGSRGFG